MILSAHQPQYLPWLGFFDKMDRADLFLLLDTVQFKKNEWQNRNRIKGPNGWHWLTVPVHHRFPQRLREVEIAGDRWRDKHRQSLEVSYGRAACFERLTSLLDGLYARAWSDLVSLNVFSARLLADLLGVRTEIRLASEFADIPEEQADERLIALCRRVGASTYLSGEGGHSYMDLGRWEDAGIEVRFQRFRHPVYSQGHGAFVPGLSAVDLLAHARDGFDLVRHARREAA